MKYLLDTCTFIWWMTAPQNLSSTALAVIADPDSEVYLSVVSIWEMEIKIDTGKLTGFSNLKTQLDSDIQFERFEMLNLDREQIHELAALPDYHKDPFDRALIAQAIHENLTIISSDSKFKGYPAKVVW